MSHFTDLKLLGRQIELLVQELAKEFGIENLGSAQFMALNYLSQNEKKEVFVKDVEKALDISKSVASNLIKRMINNGLITLEASKVDKRYKIIHLTDFGREQAIRFPEFQQRFETIMFKDVKKDELEITQKVIHQIQENISQRRNDV